MSIDELNAKYAEPEPNVADYIVEGIREFPERTVEGAVNVGKAIFDQMNPEQQRALTRAYNAGGDLFGRLVEHVAQSPTGQSIRAAMTGVDIATRPAQEAYAAAQAKQEAMGVQAPSPMDNPWFEWADPSHLEATFIPLARLVEKGIVPKAAITRAEKLMEEGASQEEVWRTIGREFGYPASKAPGHGNKLVAEISDENFQFLPKKGLAEKAAARKVEHAESLEMYQQAIDIAKRMDELGESPEDAIKAVKTAWEENYTAMQNGQQ